MSGAVDDARVPTAELETLPPAPTADDDEETTARKVYALAKAAMTCPDCGAGLRALTAFEVASGIENGTIAAAARGAAEGLQCDACGWQAALVEVAS
jgi:predicted RNA-binding Zn-ribbon protein involved in translation (DUF1610 family)